MKASDLRIGNIIHDCSGIAQEVIGIHKTGSVRFADDTVCAIDLCRGVPITKELLWSCGFYDNPNPGRYDNWVYKIKIDDEWILFDYELMLCVKDSEDSDHDKSVGLEKKYFHELQNFVFALTGFELKKV